MKCLFDLLSSLKFITRRRKFIDYRLRLQYDGSRDKPKVPWKVAPPDDRTKLNSCGASRRLLRSKLLRLFRRKQTNRSTHGSFGSAIADHSYVAYFSKTLCFMSIEHLQSEPSFCIQLLRHELTRSFWIPFRARS